MVKFEKCAYIKIRTALKETTISNHNEFINVYGEAAYSLVTIRIWVACFNAGQSEL